MSTGAPASLAAATASAADSLSFQGLNRLSAQAQANPRDPATIRAVSSQFEALLVQQMLQTANATKFGPDMLGDTGGPMFASMFAQQVATTVSQGHGLGLGDFLARELSARWGKPHAASAAAANSPHSAPNTAPNTALPAQLAARGLAAAAAAAGASTAGGLPLRGTAWAAYAADAASSSRAPAQPSPPAATGAAATSAATSATTSATPAAAPQEVATPAHAGEHERARSFIASILPSAQAAAKALGVSPLGILAQAALETGWGRHAPGNNLFGIKASAGWQGSQLQAVTREVTAGVQHLGEAAFRAYRSAAASVHDYTRLLESPRYAALRGHGSDVGGFARSLQSAGYATDPSYAHKLLQVAHSPLMRDALASLAPGEASSLPLP